MMKWVFFGDRNVCKAVRSDGSVSTVKMPVLRFELGNTDGEVDLNDPTVLAVLEKLSDPVELRNTIERRAEMRKVRRGQSGMVARLLQEADAQRREIAELRSQVAKLAGGEG